VTGVLTFVMRTFGLVEAHMTAVERVVYYIEHIPQEKSHTSANTPPAEWPQAGAIEFKDLRMRYRDETPIVLNGLTTSIAGGQRVGIVGRTGSGKSSTLLSLLRLVEPMPKEPEAAGEPSITIDGVDIEKIGLGELRRKLAIIPQSPALFTGTIRSNVDPFNDFSDEQIWEALERCEMKAAVAAMVGDGSNALGAAVAEYGENLSQGQRQLLCLARAMLQKAQILILDEATSAVDYATDARIQRMIRTAFEGCTILVIAHRINTVIDSDLVLVLGDGRLLESGSPSELLASPDSAFSKIVHESRQGDAKGDDANAK
jgi:ATP-binding cassette subfamily C (CFTR/MRP) protein 1